MQMTWSELRNRSLKQIVNTVKLRFFPPDKPACRHDPESLMVFVTNRCNFKCNTCPFTHTSPWSPPGNVPDIPVSLFESILDTYPGASMVGLVGGEPLLHASLNSLVNAAAARKMTVNISTNGSLLTDNKIHQLLDLPLASLNISVDAVDAIEFHRLRGGDAKMYETVLANAARFGTVKKERNSTLSFKLSFVTDTLNLARIPECFELARHIGADTVFCQSVLSYQCSTITSGDSILWNTPENRHFLETLNVPEDIVFVPPLLMPVTGDHDRTASCIHPFKLLAMDGAGNLSPCCVIPPHERFGNLNSDSHSWRFGPVMQKIRSEMLAGKSASESICLQCWERFSMKNG